MKPHASTAQVSGEEATRRSLAMAPSVLPPGLNTAHGGLARGQASSPSSPVPSDKANASSGSADWTDRRAAADPPSRHDAARAAVGRAHQDPSAWRSAFIFRSTSQPLVVTVTSEDGTPAAQKNKDKREDLRDEIARTLLANDLKLVNVIVSSAFVREQVSSAAHSLVGLLQAHEPPLCEPLLRDILRKKFNNFASVNPDLAALKNVLRDNSLETMMLSAFMRNEGIAYLRKVVGIALDNHLDALAASADPDKGVTPQGETRFLACVAGILHTVVHSHREIPPAIKRICRFVREELDLIMGYRTGMSKRSMSTGPPSRSTTMPVINHALVSGDSPSIISNDSGLVPGNARSFSDITARLDAPVPVHRNSTPDPGCRRERQSISEPPIADVPRRPLSVALPSLPSMAELSDTMHNRLTSQAMYSSDPNLREDDGTIRHRTRLRRSNALGKDRGPVPLYLPDQVVASFVFLRFFVPVLTAPDTFGIIPSERLTPRAQRGLLQCGKLLVAICTDQEAKVGAMTNARVQFMQEQRHRINFFMALITSPQTDLKTLPREDKTGTTLRRVSSLSALNAALSGPPGIANPPGLHPPSNPDPASKPGSVGGSDEEIPDEKPMSRIRTLGRPLRNADRNSSPSKPHKSTEPYLAPAGIHAPKGPGAARSELLLASNNVSTESMAMGVASIKEAHPTDSLIVLLDKGMARIENRLHLMRDDLGAVYKDLVVQLLTLRCLLTNFLSSTPKQTSPVAGPPVSPTSPSRGETSSSPKSSLLRRIGKKVQQIVNK